MDAEAGQLCRALDGSYAGGDEVTKTREQTYISCRHGHRVSCEEFVYREASCNRLLGWACFKLTVVVTDTTSPEFVSSQRDATERGKGLWWSIGRPRRVDTLT
jgi:hypothetical protein